MSKETVKTPLKLQIVDSYWNRGELSIRTIEGGYDGSIKRQLLAAGYEVGDVVELVVVGKVENPYVEKKNEPKVQ